MSREIGSNPVIRPSSDLHACALPVQGADSPVCLWSSRPRPHGPGSERLEWRNEFGGSALLAMESAGEIRGQPQSTSMTNKLKAELWKRFGSKAHPAEWDGHVYGGGKLSQRFWEYFKAVELLELDGDSVVVDIGGGSPVTGHRNRILRVVASHRGKKGIHLRPEHRPECGRGRKRGIRETQRVLRGNEILSGTASRGHPRGEHIGVRAHLPAGSRGNRPSNQRVFPRAFIRAGDRRRAG